MTDVRDCVYDFIKRIDELEEENEQLKKFCEEFNALNVSKENQRLKELLKELRMSVMFDKDLVEKIDEVLK